MTDHDSSPVKVRGVLILAEGNVQTPLTLYSTSDPRRLARVVDALTAVLDNDSTHRLHSIFVKALLDHLKSRTTKASFDETLPLSPLGKRMRVLMSGAVQSIGDEGRESDAVLEYKDGMDLVSSGITIATVISYPHTD